MVINGDNSNNVLNGGSGDDEINGLGGNDTINAGAGNDTVNAGDGNDTITDTEGMSAGDDDVYDGGTGVDTLIHNFGWLSSVTFDLNAGFATFNGNRDQLINIENLTVGGAASVIGSSVANVLIVNYGAGDNTISGLGGNDTIDAGAGNDTLDGGTGADSLNGGDGFDFARYSAAAAGIAASLTAPGSNTGEAAGDTYTSIEGLIGSGFDDTLAGDGGANELQGLAGNDSLYGQDGDDNLYGGAGADAHDGGAGTDYAHYETATGAVTVDLSGVVAGTGDAAGDTFVQVEGIIGTALNDQIYGDGAANELQGRDGNDTLQGRGGADVLNGGTGTDFGSYSAALAGVVVSLTGTAGSTGDAAGDTFVTVEGLIGSGFADTLGGNASANELRGLAGNDVLQGRAGADHLDGGADFDFASYANASAGLTARMDVPGGKTGDAAGDTYVSIEGVIGSGFADTLVGDGGTNELQGLAGNDSLYGQAGDDTLKGGDDADNLYGGAGADALDGGAGTDYARYDTATAAVTVDLSGVVAATGDAAGDTFVQVEGVVGTALDDQIYGDGAANQLQGRDGNDILQGRGGADVLNGGTGTDFASYSYAKSSGVTAWLGSPHSNTGEATGNTYVSIEGLIGSGFNDRLVGDSSSANELRGLGGTDSLYGEGGDDTLNGGDGGDNLYGGKGADALDGGAGNDYARYDTAASAVTVDLSGAVAGTGDAAGDTFAHIEGVVGSAHDDTLYGDALANTLQGRDGNDTLDGRLGIDLLVGGAGNDTFKFKLGEAGGDTVSDFAGNGALAGDALVFQGYGAGATFTQLTANNWSINHTGGSEVIHLANAAPVHASDYTFI